MLFGKNFVRDRFTSSVLRWRHRLNDAEKGVASKTVLAAIVLLVLTFAITLICFCGQDLLWIQFVPNTRARTQVIAEIPFNYTSQIRTERLRERRRNLIAPVYKINTNQYEKFEREIHRLDELLDAFSDKKQGTDAYIFELKTFLRGFNEKHGDNIDWNDVSILLTRTDEYGRTAVLLDGLSMLRDILYDGVFDQNIGEQRDEAYFLNIEVEGTARRVHARRESEAHQFLRLRLRSLGMAPDILEATSRILEKGIRPNIVFDNAATTAKITKVLQETPDVIERVVSGDVLIEAGSVVTDEDYERLLAYRNVLEQANISTAHADDNLIKSFFLTFAVLIFIYLFFKTTRYDLKVLSRKELCLVIVLLLLNLLICRLIAWLFETWLWEYLVQLRIADTDTPRFKDPVFLLPWIMPMTLSSLLGTLLLRTYVGVLLGLTTAIFVCLMLSQSVEFLILSFVVIFVSVYFVRHAYIRGQVIRSGNFGGLVLSVASLVSSFGLNLPHDLLIGQAVLAFLNGLSVSMAALLLLPFFENFFRCCTNIRLIELTDYSSPLLMKLQILAPGTYHHSLMVANLAEQVAIGINANPFLCRTLALYHDVGKMVKPEYFTENQSNKENPHDEKTPFMSALIIKSHVKEGAAMARAAGLPPRVVDGILEHHGTTIIRYFYTKALKQQEGLAENGEAPAITIEKSAFKYDGPEPRSKETLILLVADSIEAASRSLYNPTPQSIQTLVDKIIDGKIEEGQFDRCGITFEEVHKLRKTFYLTLLNMLHSRISYDEVKA